MQSQHHPAALVAAGLLVGGALGGCLAGRCLVGDGAPPTEEQVRRILERIDAIHAASPAREGSPAPGQVLDEREYCVQVERWVRLLWEVGSGRGTELPVVLLLAARAQHLERYAIQRSSQPKGRVGYLTWRTQVKARQGARIEQLLGGGCFSEKLVERVRGLVSKSLPLATDGHMQAIEDGTCLVFLETELNHFAANGISGPKDDAAMINILKKTWLKMSCAAHGMALGIATFSPHMLGCVCEAIEQAEQATATAEARSVATTNKA